MFSKSSRYARVGEYHVTGLDGVPHLCKKIRFIPPSAGVFRHTVREGDRLDLLAYRYYGDPEKFWLIVDANNVVLADDLLQPGRQIIIPPDTST